MNRESKKLQRMCSLLLENARSCISVQAELMLLAIRFENRFVKFVWFNDKILFGIILTNIYLC